MQIDFLDIRWITFESTSLQHLINVEKRRQYFIPHNTNINQTNKSLNAQKYRWLHQSRFYLNGPKMSEMLGPVKINFLRKSILLVFLKIHTKYVTKS